MFLSGGAQYLEETWTLAGSTFNNLKQMHSVEITQLLPLLLLELHTKSLSFPFGNVLLPPSLQGPHPFTHPSPHVYGQEFFPIFGSRLSNWSLILWCAVYLPPCCICFQGSLTCSSFLFHLTWPRCLQQSHVPLLNPAKGKKGKPDGPPYNFPCSLHRRTPCKRAWENGSSKFSSKAVFQQALPKLVSWNSMS